MYVLINVLVKVLKYQFKQDFCILLTIWSMPPGTKLLMQSRLAHQYFRQLVTVGMSINLSTTGPVMTWALRVVKYIITSMFKGVSLSNHPPKLRQQKESIACLKGCEIELLNNTIAFKSHSLLSRAVHIPYHKIQKRQLSRLTKSVYIK